MSNKCTAPGCENTNKGWRSSSVGDFIKDNPGWLWGITDACEQFQLCPKHAYQAAELAYELSQILGEFGANPILLRHARELKITKKGDRQ